jgi:CspA family cold shock protein
MKGRVKWFNDKKGYGFIEYEDGKDIFVHYSSIRTDNYKTLVEGELVEFEVVMTDRGLQAKNVREIKPILV